MMNSLADLTIERLVANYSDDILHKLKGETQYKIVTDITTKPIFRISEAEYTINQYLEEAEIMTKFLIKLLLNFDIHDLSYFSWAEAKQRILKYNYRIFDPDKIKSLSSYLDYLKYFLKTINEKKEIDNRLYKLTNFWNEFVEQDDSVDALLLEIYEDTVNERNLRYFRYGFILQESLELYELLNEFIEENEIPDYIDISSVYIYELAYLYDYVICYFHDDLGDFKAFIIKDPLNIKLDMSKINTDFELRIYQVVH